TQEQADDGLGGNGSPSSEFTRERRTDHGNEDIGHEVPVRRRIDLSVLHAPSDEGSRTPAHRRNRGPRRRRGSRDDREKAAVLTEVGEHPLYPLPDLFREGAT